MDIEHADANTAKMAIEYIRVISQEYGAIEILRLPEAAVCGQGAVVTRTGEILTESVAEFVAHGLVPDGLTKTDVGFSIPHAITRKVDRPCLLAKRPWFRNYGHWLVDAATVLASCTEIIRERGLTLVIGACESDGMRKVMTDTVERIIPGVEILFHPDDEAWSFTDLYYVAPLHVPPLFKLPSALEKVRSAMLMEHNPTASRKLFVSRGASGNLPRSLINEDEILGLCKINGFELVFPEKLSIVEQARLFADAHIVVGVKGAALTNIIFCQPNAVLITLSPADFPDPFFWDIAGQRSMAYGEIFGPIFGQSVQGQNSFTIDRKKMESVLIEAERLG